jgi:hypothetical protein
MRKTAELERRLTTPSHAKISCLRCRRYLSHYLVVLLKCRDQYTSPVRALIYTNVLKAAPSSS